jgi:nucleoside-diphosphate kinase
MEQTLVIIKPDAVKRGLIGKIIDRLETRGLQLQAMKFQKLNEDILKKHYAHLVDKPFFSGLVKFMMKTPVVLQVWAGKEAIKTVRTQVGVTNSRDALPGTIRGDFSMSMSCNVVHASEDLENAKKEIKNFFTESEIFKWDQNEGVMYADDEI